MPCSSRDNISLRRHFRCHSRQTAFNTSALPEFPSREACLPLCKMVRLLRKSLVSPEKRIKWCSLPVIAFHCVLRPKDINISRQWVILLLFTLWTSVPSIRTGSCVTKFLIQEWWVLIHQPILTLGADIIPRLPILMIAIRWNGLVIQVPLSKRLRHLPHLTSLQFLMILASQSRMADTIVAGSVHKVLPEILAPVPVDCPKIFMIRNLVWCQQIAMKIQRAHEEFKH